jgi:hypothetical protein
MVDPLKTSAKSEMVFNLGKVFLFSRSLTLFAGCPDRGSVHCRK